mmetsp:Transcript_47120/g.121780  ORF Transcript_47120/g.121780 Transcript_47120/m.121780 type:complete len:420 (-) Transcript_47120:299-1558(-)
MPTYQGSEFWVLTGPNQAAGYWLDAAPSLRVGRSDPTVYGGKNTLTRNMVNDEYFGAQCAIRRYEYGCPVRMFIGGDLLEDDMIYRQYAGTPVIMSTLSGNFMDDEGRNYTFCAQPASSMRYPFIFFTYTTNGVMPDGYGALVITESGDIAKGYIFDSGLYYTRITFSLVQSNSTEGFNVNVAIPDWEIMYSLTAGGSGAGYCWVPEDQALYGVYSAIESGNTVYSSSMNGFFDVTDSTPAMGGKNETVLATSKLQMCRSGYGEFVGTATVNGMSDALKGNINQGTYFFGGGIMTGVSSVYDETYPESYADGLPSQRASVIVIGTSWDTFSGFATLPSMNLFGHHPYGYGTIRKGVESSYSENYYTRTCNFPNTVGAIDCPYNYGSSDPWTVIPVFVYVSLGIIIGGSALVALIRSISN